MAKQVSLSKKGSFTAPCQKQNLNDYLLIPTVSIYHLDRKLREEKKILSFYQIISHYVYYLMLTAMSNELRKENHT